MLRFAIVSVLCASALCSLAAHADESTTATPAEAGPQTDRIILSADGDRLTGTNGGAGGDITYLHQEGAVLVGVAAEYQRLATSRWGFGSFNIAYSHDLTATSRWNVHAEAHEGTGRTAGSPFLYSIEAAGLGAAFPHAVSADVEERQIDVDTSHGSLPKAALSKGWGSHLLTTVGYAHSIGGNLDSSYGLLRLDVYLPGVNLIAGGDLGRVSPTVLNINGVLTSQARHLKEEFGGISKPFKRFELTLLGDKIDLAGVSRFTLTLNCSIPLP